MAEETKAHDVLNHLNTVTVGNPTQAEDACPCFFCGCVVLRRLVMGRSPTEESSQLSRRLLV